MVKCVPLNVVFQVSHLFQKAHHLAQWSLVEMKLLSSCLNDSCLCSLAQTNKTHVICIVSAYIIGALTTLQKTAFKGWLLL